MTFFFHLFSFFSPILIFPFACHRSSYISFYFIPSVHPSAFNVFQPFFFSNTHSHSSLFFHRQFCFPSWHNCPASRFPLGLNEQGQFLVAALWLTIWCQFLFWQMLTSTSSLNSSQLLPLLLRVVKVFIFRSRVSIIRK